MTDDNGKFVGAETRTGIAPTGRRAAAWRTLETMEMINRLTKDQWGFVSFDSDNPHASAQAAQGPIYQAASAWHGYGEVRTSVVPVSKIPNYNGSETDFAVVVALKRTEQLG